AEDGIRDRTVTGVHTCALPITAYNMESVPRWHYPAGKTGRRSCRPLSPSAPGEQYWRLRYYMLTMKYNTQAGNYAKLLISRLRRSEERRVGKECRSGDLNVL